jgi:hypothetical protein
VDNIKMDFGEIGWGSASWIVNARDRNKWRALVNAVKTFEFHKMLESYTVATKLVSSGVMLSSI